MRLNKFYVKKWIKKNKSLITLLFLIAIIPIVAIIAFGNKDNVLLKKIVKLIDEEEKKFINLSKEETEETKSEIKDLESEVEKTKEKIKEIENTRSKKEDLDSFFDERLR